MDSYLTLDHLPLLSQALRDAARPLSFAAAAPNQNGNDLQAAFVGLDAAAARNPVFRFEAVQGHEYFFQSISYLDPVRLTVYDRAGKAVLANDEGDDPAQSVLNGLVVNQDVTGGWRAPYSGSFFIDASWFTFPGIFDHTGLVVLVDRDAGTANLAPRLVAPIADIGWSEGAAQSAVLPFAAFQDPDADPLAISVSSADGSALPGWLSFNAQSRQLSGTPPVDAPDLNLLVTATDPARLNVSDTVRLLTAPPTGGLTVNGGAAADTLKGSRFGDTFNGGAGNDVLTGAGGNDTIRGGSGVDTAVYAGARAGFKVEAAGAGWSVTDSAGTEGKDSLSEIERLQFSDGNVALDLGGSAGIVAKVLGAVFGPGAVGNKTYVGIGLKLADEGTGYVALGALALAAAGKTAPRDVVDLLWSNLVGSAPSAEQAQPFVDMLGSGTSAGQLVQLAADTALNAQNIDLVGLAGAGLDYLPG